MKIEILYKGKNGFLEAKVIKVKNLDLDYIRTLDFYKENFYCFKLIQNNEVKQTIYRGKRLSFATFKKIIGNDPKYKSLRLKIGILEERAFSLLQDQIIDEDAFLEEFEKENWVLFMGPDNFDVSILQYDKTAITIEEYDKNIDLGLDKYIRAIFLNSIIGCNYASENEMLLEIFTNFFQMFFKSVWAIVDNEENREYALEIIDDNIDNIYKLYKMITFNFEEFGLNTWESKKEFLEYFEYVYDMDRSMKKVFNIYVDFLNNDRTYHNKR